MITLEFKSGPLEGQRLDFSGGRVIIGRGSSCDCVIDDPKVSTVHCLLEEGPDGLTIEDLGSRNGTIIAGQAVDDRVAIKAGEHFHVGRVLIRVWWNQAEPLIPAGVVLEKSDASEPTIEAFPPSFGDRRAAEAPSNRPLSAPADDSPPLPKAGPRPTLRGVSGAAVGIEHRLSGRRTVVGRGELCAVSLVDARIALEHLAVVEEANDSFQAIPLNPDSPVRVNGAVVGGGTTLHHGDLIQTGGAVLEFIAAGIDIETDSPMNTMALAAARFVVHGQLYIQPELVLGRDPGCDVFLERGGPGVGRRHCALRFELGMFKIIALGSHSVEVNGKPVVEAFLAHDDHVTVGDYDIGVSISGLTCDLELVTSATQPSSELFASNIDHTLSMQTMFRAALDLSAIESERIEEKPIERSSLVWVPPLDVKKTRIPLIAAVACVICCLGAVAAFNWPVGRGLLDRPLSDAHSTQAFVDASIKYTGDEPSCGSCHDGFAGVTTARCGDCHEAQVQAGLVNHGSEGLACTACHTDHPTQTEHTALLVEGRCAECHHDRHAKTLLAMTAGPADAVDHADITALRFGVSVDALHQSHAGVKGRCAGCHADEARSAPVEPRTSCLRCHGSKDEMQETSCGRCHASHGGEVAGPPRKTITAVESPMRPVATNVGYAMAILAVMPLFVVLGFRRRDNEKTEAANEETAKTSQKPKKEIHILEEPCVGCGECVVVCPFDVLGLVKLRSSGKTVARVLNFESCNECGFCEAVCKPQALTRRAAGEPLPLVNRPDLDANYMTAVPGLYLIGEAAGRALVRNASNLGARTVRHLVHEGLYAGSSASCGIDYDVIIVGSGPAGLSAALTAIEHGLSYLVVEKGADYAQTIRNYPKGKWVQNQPNTVQDVGALPLLEGSREDLLALWAEHLQNNPVNISFNAEVMGVSQQPLETTTDHRHDSYFSVSTKDRVYTGLKVILATGTRGNPVKLSNVPGHELAKVRYSLVDASQLRSQRIAVVGGGNSALETAIALAEQGGVGRITLVHRGTDFRKASAKNTAKLDRLKSEGKVTVLLETQVAEISPNEIRVMTNGQAKVLQNDIVYCLLGAKAPTAWLKRLGVTFGMKPQTWNPGPTDDLARVPIG